jgi:hypothetical protein
MAMRWADLSTAFFTLKRTVGALENFPDGLNFLLPDNGVLFFPRLSQFVIDGNDVGHVSPCRINFPIPLHQHTWRENYREK